MFKAKVYLGHGREEDDIEIITLQSVEKYAPDGIFGKDFFEYATDNFLAFMEENIPGGVYDRIVRRLADELGMGEDEIYIAMARISEQALFKAIEAGEYELPSKEEPEPKSEPEPEPDTEPIKCRHIK